MIYKGSHIDHTANILYRPGWMCDCGQSYEEHEIVKGKRLCFPDEYPTQEYFPVVNVVPGIQ